MITYKNGSIFTSDMQVLVNTVNCFGAMGKGIALEYKTLYPDMYKKYRKFCLNGQLRIGQLYLWSNGINHVLNFPTKNHWKQDSSVHILEQGLINFVNTYKKRGVKSIAFPQLGCQNGGLNWDNQVKPLMEKYLSNLDIPVEIWIYN